VTQNIVRAATWLLFALSGTAGIFFLLGADFIGATQLLIYVGGTLVLVVFGVMLTAQGPFITMKTAPPIGHCPSSLACCSTASSPSPSSSPTGARALKADGRFRPGDVATARCSAALLGVGRPRRKARSPECPATAATRKRVAYLLPFEIVSVHLLVVLIGAAYLARAKRRRGTAA
jgi:hypothetical protein